MRPAPTPPAPPSSVNDLVGYTAPLGYDAFVSALDDGVYNEEAGFSFMYDKYYCLVYGPKDSLNIGFLANLGGEVYEFAYTTSGQVGTIDSVDMGGDPSSSVWANLRAEIQSLGLSVDEIAPDSQILTSWPVCIVTNE